MRERGSVVMATRIEPAVYAQLEEKVAGLRYPSARICAIAPAAIKPQHYRYPLSRHS